MICLRQVLLLFTLSASIQALDKCPENIQTVDTLDVQKVFFKYISCLCCCTGWKKANCNLRLDHFFVSPCSILDIGMTPMEPIAEWRQKEIVALELLTNPLVSCAHCSKPQFFVPKMNKLCIWYLNPIWQKILKSKRQKIRIFIRKLVKLQTQKFNDLILF